jgi:hypothetical protein
MVQEPNQRIALKNAQIVVAKEERRKLRKHPKAK